MLKKSELYGTTLTVGPRLKKLSEAGYSDILWSENYPEQEKPTRDGVGEFQKTREWIETAPLEEVFDLWCRGHNLIGYAGLLLKSTDVFKRVCK